MISSDRGKRVSNWNKNKKSKSKRKGAIVKLKLGDIRSKAKQMNNDRLIHLKRFWTTQDPDDALEFCGRSASKTPIFPPWWTKYNTSKSKVRFKIKSLHYVEVLKSLIDHGYDPEMFHSGHMKLDQRKTLIDGNHRFDLLYAKHGPEYETEFLMVGWIQTAMVIVITFVIVSLYVALFVGLILIQLMCSPYYIVIKLFNFAFRNESKE